MSDDPRIYVRVHAMLLNDITTGVLRPGGPVPSIASLCRQFGGGRQTIARALHMLEDDAWLICYPGLGYYVAPEHTTEGDGRRANVRDRSERPIPDGSPKTSADLAGQARLGGENARGSGGTKTRSG